mmetsp:Transcript_9782/g.14400  ORF Transcript_9782/g.14400 Transcript_9782/m.14400 type:complete len:146 (+) Transcript_9782:97-534(+)
MHDNNNNTNQAKHAFQRSVDGSARFWYISDGVTQAISCSHSFDDHPKVKQGVLALPSSTSKSKRLLTTVSTCEIPARARRCLYSTSTPSGHPYAESHSRKVVEICLWSFKLSTVTEASTGSGTDQRPNSWSATLPFTSKADTSQQ